MFIPKFYYSPEGDGGTGATPAQASAGEGDPSGDPNLADQVVSKAEYDKLASDLAGLQSKLDKGQIETATVMGKLIARLDEGSPEVPATSGDNGQPIIESQSTGQPPASQASGASKDALSVDQVVETLGFKQDDPDVLVAMKSDDPASALLTLGVQRNANAKAAAAGAAMPVGSGNAVEPEKDKNPLDGIDDVHELYGMALENFTKK